MSLRGLLQDWRNSRKNGARKSTENLPYIDESTARLRNEAQE
jgi:hypothetical protein